MTDRVTGSPATGLFWSGGRPRLDLGGETSLDCRPGTTIGVRLGATRRCIGWWHRETGRNRCGAEQPIPDAATDAQCAACARADHGRRVARDAAPDDGRPYRVYLAGFGDDTVKVGITSAARGTNRLTEQGALAFLFIAEARLTIARAAERAISRSGLATERVRVAHKPDRWWCVDPDGPQRLRDTRSAIDLTVTLPAGLRRLSEKVTEQGALFGLDRPLPPTYRALLSVEPGSALSGRVLVAAGKLLLLDTAAGPVLCDTRRLAGWPLGTTDEAPTGLVLDLPHRPRTQPIPEQAALF